MLCVSFPEVKTGGRGQWHPSVRGQVVRTLPTLHPLAFIDRTAGSPGEERDSDSLLLFPPHSPNRGTGPVAEHVSVLVRCGVAIL